MARRLANKGKRSLPRITELGRRKYANNNQKISEYQKRIKDMTYVDHAIERIAAELTHFLTK